MKRILFSLGVVLFLSAFTQMGSSQSALGTPAFGSFAGGPDIVNLGNLNVYWNFPIMNKAGRGLPFTYSLDYDTTIWMQTTSGTTTSWGLHKAGSNFGWPAFGTNTNTAAIPGIGGSVNYTTTTHSTGGACVNSVNVHSAPATYTATLYQLSNFVYVDAQGTSHSFPTASAQYVVLVSSTSSGCGPTNSNSSNTYTSSDGYTLALTMTNSSLSTVVTNKSGKSTVNVPAVCSSDAVTRLLTTESDMNGNLSTASACGIVTDTLGTTALTQTGSTASGQVVFTGTTVSGMTSTWQLNYKSYTVQTNFGCSGISEYGPDTQELPYELLLPDGRSYQFTYEPTPGNSTNITGRLASVTLPTGGTISYAYTGGSNGINCTDGSPVTLTRITPDGTTTYTRNTSGLAAPGTQGANTSAGYAYTTISDPQNNQTLLTSTVSYYGPSLLNSYYENARQIYSGSIASGTLLETILTCYTGYGVSSTCTTTAPGNSSSSSYDEPTGATTIRKTYQWPNSSGVSNGTLDTYDSVQNVTSHVVYDYSAASSLPSTVLQTTNTSYATLNSSETTYPSEVSVYDASGNAAADTQYTYNGTSTIATSGTPQNQVQYARPMNLTSVSKLVSSGVRLTSSSTYYDNGTLASTTDVNGATTTYTYGSGSCGNSFPTSTSSTTGNSAVPTLTTSATWNCDGGVQLTNADVNSNLTTYNYGSDPYWRPVSVTDPAQNLTSYSYQSSSSNTSEVSESFNGGSSISDTLTTYDGLGRTILTQKRQGPSSSTYDSVAVAYDSLGRTSYTSLPYSAEEGTYSTSGPGVSTNYDALSRTSLVTDSGGGSVTYGYNGNDVLVTQRPAPSGENAKSRNLQYDGAGRLSSVCEVVTSTKPAGGACGQYAAYTGYLTRYTYDGASRLLSVAQNAQPGNSGTQTRTLAYDNLGRKLSETIPEWSAGTGAAGTSTYTYDSSSTCGSSSAGDLVQTVDNAGNVTCLTYDLLHRPLSSKVISGTYASVTPQTYMVYDAASLSGTAMQNVKGAAAEAYTCAESCTSKLTDIFSSSSYQNGGVLSQMWESTPNSGGYFLTQSTSYANGAQAALSATLAGASFGMPSMTYGIDGEGRPFLATDATNQLNLVGSVSYNTAGAPTAVLFGNGDSDGFSYDSNTGRPTQFQYSVLANTATNTAAFNQTGVLTWNPNGSLNTFAFTDGNDSTKNQNCAYSLDDLSRLASVSCGGAWAQTFTYDAFGNIQKSGSGNYSAGYSALTNQVNSGVTAAYDSNGNQTKSTNAWLAWNASAQPVTVTPAIAGSASGAAVAGTYDALGRLVETGVGGVYTQFVYSPSGGKLAVVQGGALVKATIPLPGGETAVYNASGLNFIRHKDWLGSSRLATTWAHGVYSKESYAPFGETYNEAGTPDRSFTGQDQDTTGGVYDFLFRKYDPAAGRWLSPDPLGWGAVTQEVPQSLNRYAYVQNNPNSLIDPNGLECVWDNGSYDSADDVSTGSVDGCTGQGGTWVDPSVFEAVEGNQYGSWSGQASSSVAFDWTTPSVIVNGDISGAASAYETIGQSFLPMSTPQSGGNAHNNGQNPNGTIAQGHPKASFWTNLGETLGCLAGMDPNYVGPSTTRDSTPRDPLNSTKGTSGSRGGTPIPDAINQASSITQCLINVSKE